MSHDSHKILAARLCDSHRVKIIARCRSHGSHRALAARSHDLRRVPHQFLCLDFSQE